MNVLYEDLSRKRIFAQFLLVRCYVLAFLRDSSSCQATCNAPLFQFILLALI
jgi:hypothetical protein